MRYYLSVPVLRAVDDEQLLSRAPCTTSFPGTDTSARRYNVTVQTADSATLRDVSVT